MKAELLVRSSAMAVVLVCASCDDNEEGQGSPAEVGWEPGTVMTGVEDVGARGFLDRRGIIHAHSVYSHDACDGEPIYPDGSINQQCFDDLRMGICQTKHDFLMLTDHASTLTHAEFPELLQYRSERGDVLVQRNGEPVANWAGCPDGPPALIMVGCEQATMPVGLEHHVAATHEERRAVYDSKTPEAIEQLKAAGAVALVQHTEDWTVDELATLPLDGFEMYNLHANMISGAGAIFGLVRNVINDPSALPHPDLIVIALFNEDPRYLERWGSVLARGARRVTTMATDAHRNTVRTELPDGERVDSYRRMMLWFSNHLLLRPEADGTWDDTHLKDALRAGRLYGAFEYLGYPIGFDYHATEGGSVREMGDEVSLQAGVDLHVAIPTVDGSGAGAQPPRFARIFRARENGWDVITESESNFIHPVTEAGVYRVEIRMFPRHLLAHLSSYSELADRDFVWIYSNPIYVRN